MNRLSNLTLKNKLLLGFFALMLVAVPVTVFVVSRSDLFETRSRADLSGDINILSKQLLADQGNESEQISASVKRKELVQKLAKSDPETFLLNTITPDIKNTLPQLAQDNIESKTQIQGIIIENVAEAHESTEDALPPFSIQQLDSEGFVIRSYLLYLREGQDIQAGQTAKIEGYSIGNILVPTKIDILSSPPSPEELSLNITGQNVLGVSTVGDNKKIAVLMVNFKRDLSDTSREFTREELAEIYFTGSPSTTKYLRNASFNKLNFQGGINDVYGWITIPNFSRSDVCDINETGAGKGFKKAAIDKARVQAEQRGINFDDYEFIGFVFPWSSDCSWGSAIASGVGNVDSYAKPHHFLNGDYCARSSSCSSKDKKFYAGLMAHEMGHNLGLSHANGLDCGTKIIDNYANCRSITYGDRFDISGGAWTYFPFSSSPNQIIRLDWIPPENRTNVNENTINATGTYRLHTTSKKQDAGKTQFIKIPRPVNGGAYYLEYRTKHGLDSSIPTAVTDGALIRLSEIPNGVLKNENGDLQYRPQQTYLLDLSNRDPASWADFLNPSLKDGRTFEDTKNRIKVTQLAHDPTNGTVDLKIELGPPPCEKLDPGLIVTEPSLSGKATETVRYELTVKNNNSESCADANFVLSAAPPTGWNAAFTNSQLTIPSGETRVTYVSITPPQLATTDSNPYLTQITVKNTQDASLSRTKQVSYSIEDTSVTVSPQPATNTPTPTRRPTNTPTPTTRPTNTPTPRPTSTPTPKPVTPTAGPTATNTPTPPVGKTFINFPSVKLHGIGRGGDNLNPTSIGNTNPLTKTRNLDVDILNGSNISVAKVQGNIVYDTATGEFKGDIELPDTLQNGEKYLIKVKSNKYITKQMDGFIVLTKGAINTASQISLTAGDANSDDEINILDYNIIQDCYSEFLPAKNCDATKKSRADLNDDGQVNRGDYGLFIRELSVQSGH
jgi:hypothetical protein